MIGMRKLKTITSIITDLSNIVGVKEVYIHDIHAIRGIATIVVECNYVVNNKFTGYDSLGINLRKVKTHFDNVLADYSVDISRISLPTKRYRKIAGIRYGSYKTNMIVLEIKM